MHEDFRREDRVDGPSDRRFGLVFVAVFLLIALAPLIHGRSPRIWSFAVALAVAVVALFVPSVLGPLNRLWAKLGLLLHKIVSPVVLGIMFFMVITPIGVIMRRRGKDLLRLRLDPETQTYWIERTPPGPRAESFVNQF